jgi:hypothetical protein
MKAQLEIGSTNDPQEQQADQTADNIMRMPESPFVQRKCASCEHEEEKVSRKTEPFIQKQGNGLEGGTASESVTNQINSSRGGGNRMSENTLNFMESRFNTGFSGVKIHTDSNAVQMSRELNAQAFTVGNDIYFNEGKYSPESASGKHLLAHELTHTVQQSEGIGMKIQCDRRGDRETDRETERGRRRRDTEGGRGRASRLGSDLDSDWAGRAILGRYLLGTGDWTIINNPSWSSYMKASQMLKSQIIGRLLPIIPRGIRIAEITNSNSFAVYENFAAVIENGEGIIGYQYLHGTNADVGGFVIYGNANVTKNPNGAKMITFDLNFQWNDMIDPNPEYSTDTWKSILGEIITLGQSESYAIHITWSDTSYVILDQENNIFYSLGYPFV